jgi:hypothetical protein
MTSNRRVHLSILAIVFLLTELLCGGTITISENSEAKAVVVVAKDASAAEKHAAEELASFLGQVTGGDFKIVNDADAEGAKIFVGKKAFSKSGLSISTPELDDEGVVIHTFEDNLVLMGDGDRGTLYAVYTFLEDCVGCRWWSSTASYIPSKPTLKVDNFNYCYVPPIEYRESFWYDAFDGDWAVRNKCNGNSSRLDEKRGGKHTYQGFVHTFYWLIPPDKYFKQHPEWFSEIEGKRKHERAQLCLANEQMRKELVKNLKANLRNNPAATIASVSQNDWHGRCQCKKCLAIEQEEGGPAGPLLHFVNAVAADIENEFPKVAISTLAYQYTRKPPAKVKLRDNVIVRLCSIECSFSKPLADERNKAFRDDIVGWSKICNRLYVWDYVTNFRHYVMPHPNLRVLGPNVKFFAEHNVKGLFEQGSYNTYGAEMAELRAWVLAKLLWDPRRDGRELIEEFIQGYYGSAGSAVKNYLNLIHDAVEQSGDWLGCFSELDAKFLSYEVLSKGWSFLKDAEVAAGDDEDLRFRVRVAQLPVMYTVVRKWKQMKKEAQEANLTWVFPDSAEQFYSDFKEIASAKKVKRLNEWTQGYGVLEEAVSKIRE